ncbi:MAG: hypothetical protein JO278_04595, partial [Dyella sp.]|nr:hypothetical protein [Dyella sp.]
GFYLGRDGRFSLGGALTWNGSKLTVNGSGTFSGALQAATGTFRGALQAASGTFTGALQAASGTFSGSLTADAINAVSTINVAGGSVTAMAFGGPVSGSVPAGTMRSVVAVTVNMPDSSTGITLQASGSLFAPAGQGAQCSISGPGVSSNAVLVSLQAGYNGAFACTAFANVGGGVHTFYVNIYAANGIDYQSVAITATGGKR